MNRRGTQIVTEGLTLGAAVIVFWLMLCGGCGLKAGVNEVGRDQNAQATTEVVPLKPATTQTSTDTKRVATSQSATGGAESTVTTEHVSTDSKAQQSGGINLNWQTVAAGGGGAAVLGMWLGFTLKVKQVDAEYDQNMLTRMFDLLTHVVDSAKRF